MNLPNANRYAKMARVIDGDTFVAVIYLADDITVRKPVRVFGVDTPEKFRPFNAFEKQHGMQATAYAKKVLKGRTLVLEAVKNEDKYGRHLAKVWVDMDGIWRDLASLLISAGLYKRTRTEYSNNWEMSHVE